MTVEDTRRRTGWKNLLKSRSECGGECSKTNLEGEERGIERILQCKQIKGVLTCAFALLKL